MTKHTKELHLNRKKSKWREKLNQQELQKFFFPFCLLPFVLLNVIWWLIIFAEKIVCLPKAGNNKIIFLLCDLIGNSPQPNRRDTLTAFISNEETVSAYMFYSIRRGNGKFFNLFVFFCYHCERRLLIYYAITAELVLVSFRFHFHSI